MCPTVGGVRIEIAKNVTYSVLGRISHLFCLLFVDFLQLQKIMGVLQ